MKTRKLNWLIAAICCVTFFSCKDPEITPTSQPGTGSTNGTTTSNTNTGTGSSNSGTTNGSSASIPDVYKKIYGATDMYVDGNYLVIKSNGLPDHKTAYYEGTQWASTMYAADNNPSFRINPSRIAQQSLTFRIPINPVKASSAQATPMGPMGVAVNGIPFFNQYAAGGSPLSSEIVSFDQYGGHPQQQGQYHYHVEPAYITANKGKDALLGFLLDGFPVYGPTENGKTISSSDLDVYHGHFGVTADYPNGIYHYHTTAAAPYINGSGFYGTAGTVTY